MTEFHHHLNHDLTYTGIETFNQKLTMGKGAVNFCFRSHTYINITFKLIFQLFKLASDGIYVQMSKY